MLNKIKAVGHLQPRRGVCKIQQGFMYIDKKKFIKNINLPIFFIVTDFV